MTSDRPPKPPRGGVSVHPRASAMCWERRPSARQGHASGPGASAARLGELAVPPAAGSRPPHTASCRQQVWRETSELGTAKVVGVNVCAAIDQWGDLEAVLRKVSSLSRAGKRPAFSLGSYGTLVAGVSESCLHFRERFCVTGGLGLSRDLLAHPGTAVHRTPCSHGGQLPSGGGSSLCPDPRAASVTVMTEEGLSRACGGQAP